MLDLDNIARLAEDSQLEAKAASDGLPKSVWSTYSAFANSNGGVILLGVKELSGHHLMPVGIADPVQMRADFWNALNGGQVASPNILTDEDVSIERIEGVDILVIRVPRANPADKPVHLKDNPFKNSFRRNGEGDYRCSEEEVRNMIRDSAAESADKRPLDNRILDDLCPETLAAYRQSLMTLRPTHPWNSLPDADFLIRIDAAVKSPGSSAIRPTRAGLLMFGWEHAITAEFPFYFLDYREVKSDRRWDDRIMSSDGEWSGNIFDFWQRVAPKVTAGLARPFELEGMHRIDDTPMHRALREALANMLLHADYYGGMGSTVVLYDDKAVLTNPGSLLISRDAVMAGGTSRTRNPSLMKMFNLLQIGERAGSGFDTIRAGCESEGLPSPELRELFAPDKVVLSVPLPAFSFSHGDEAPNIVRGSAFVLNPNSKDGSFSADEALKVLESYGSNGNTREAARMILARDRVVRRDLEDHLQVSKATANNILKDLVTTGILVKRGSGPSTYYTHAE